MKKKLQNRIAKTMLTELEKKLYKFKDKYDETWEVDFWKKWDIQDKSFDVGVIAGMLGMAQLIQNNYFNYKPISEYLNEREKGNFDKYQSKI